MDLASDLKPGLVAISGGLGDIGKAMAQTLGDAGADLALGDLTASAGEHSSGNAFYRPLDVADASAVEAWYDEVERHFGRVPNVIVANAAIFSLKPLLELSAEEWTREVQVNLSGAYFFAKAGAARLRHRQQKGRILFVGSWAAHAPHPALPAYSVAKAGLRMLCQCLALELASSGILVNELAPGYVDAGLSGRVYEKNPTLKARAVQAVPVGRLIHASEVATQALYLCSDYAGQMTGSTLLMDGGLSLLQGPQTVHE